MNLFYTVWRVACSFSFRRSFHVLRIFLGCGGHLNRNSGTISSPNYPKAYPKNIVCEWLIEVDYGSSIVMEFIDIDIEVTDNCEFDHIRVNL